MANKIDLTTMMNIIQYNIENSTTFNLTLTSTNDELNTVSSAYIVCNEKDGDINGHLEKKVINAPTYLANVGMMNKLAELPYDFFEGLPISHQTSKAMQLDGYTGPITTHMRNKYSVEIKRDPVIRKYVFGTLHVYTREGYDTNILVQYCHNADSGGRISIHDVKTIKNFSVDSIDIDISQDQNSDISIELGTDEKMGFKDKCTNVHILPRKFQSLVIAFKGSFDFLKTDTGVSESTVIKNPGSELIAIWDELK